MAGPGDKQTFDANGVMAAVYDHDLKALRVSSSGTGGGTGVGTAVADYIQAGETNHSLALQRAIDALPFTASLTGGGPLDLTPAAGVPWRFASKVFIDLDVFSYQLVLNCQVASPLFIDDGFCIDSCAMTNASTFTDTSANLGPEDIGTLITGDGFAAGTTVTNIVGTTVSTSNPWTGGAVQAAIRFKRYLIYVNISRTTGNNVRGGGINSPGLVVNNAQIQLSPTRTVTDSVANGTATLTSATAAFTASDLGAPVSGTHIPALTYIGVVNSPTSIGLSSTASSNTPVSSAGSGSGGTLNIQVDQNTLCCFALTSRAAIQVNNSQIEYLYRCAVTSGYTDNASWYGVKYVNSPVGTLLTDLDMGVGYMYEQTGSGDGLVVMNCKGGGAANLLNLSNNNGAIIGGLITGAMRFQSCSGIEISGFHWDSNQPGITYGIYAQNSQLTLIAPWWHAGPAKADSTAQWHFLVIDDTNSDTDAAPQHLGSQIVILGGSGSFRYDHTGNGTAAEDDRYPDININSFNTTTRIQVRGLRYYMWKQAASSNADTGHELGGIWIGSYTDGKTTAKKAQINTAYVAAGSIVADDFEMRCSAANTFIFRQLGTHGLRTTKLAGAAPTIAANATDMPGAIAAGTPYNYQCAVRNVDGSFGPISAIATIATPGASTVNEIVVSGLSDGPQNLVVWASINGTPSTTPTQYVILPFNGVQTLLRDTGTRCNGRNWLTSAIPAIATSTDFTWPGYVAPSGQRVAWLASFPSSALSGPWAIGDQVWNTAPASATTPGWVCTAAGSPGTWKAMAIVAV